MGIEVKGEIEMEILNLGAAILPESAVEPLPDDAPDLAEMVEAQPLKCCRKRGRARTGARSQEDGKGGEQRRAPALGGGEAGKRVKPVPMPKALCAQAVAWWPAASGATSAAPLPLSFGGTDGITGADGSVWSLRATPNGKGKGRAEWQWDVADGLGGTAPQGRFAHFYSAAATEGNGSIGRPWPTALSSVARRLRAS